MTKKKPYWEMTTEELAEATREFDRPGYKPPAVKPTARQMSQLRRWQQRHATAKSKVVVSLEKKLIIKADDYAARHGITFSDLLSMALKHQLRKKSA